MFDLIKVYSLDPNTAKQRPKIGIQESAKPNRTYCLEIVGLNPCGMLIFMQSNTVFCVCGLLNFNDK